jgi:hypothetical protein
MAGKPLHGFMKTLLVLTLLAVAQSAPTESGSVTGLIRSADGSPAAGVEVIARVVAQNPATVIFASEGQTDTQGRYRLENLPTGRYLITAGLHHSPSYFPGVKTPQEARSVAVVEGQLVTGIDFTLVTSPGVRVRGRVINLPTTVASNLLTVALQAIDKPGSYLTATVPRQNGQFEFPKVAPGPYNVRLLAGNTPPARVNVENKDVDGVRITAGMFAFGRASVDDGSPLPPQRIVLAASIPDPYSDQAGGGVVHPNGRFFLPLAAPPRDYRIFPTMLPLGYYVKSMTAGNVDLLQSSVGANALLSTEIKVVLTKTRPPDKPVGARVSGRVTKLQYARRDTLYLSLESSPTFTSPTRITGSATANRDGTFEFRNVPPGRYALSAPPSPTTTFEITNRDISNLELPLPGPRRPIPVAPPPATPQAGRLFFTETGVRPQYEESAITFFQVDRDGTRVENARVDATSFVTLQPGRYSLRSYFRICNGNCSRLQPPSAECFATFSITVGQVLNAERAMKGETCTLRFNAVPPR